MSVLSQDEVKQLLIQWRDQISPHMESVRRAQDVLLLEVGPEHTVYALSMMTVMLGKGGGLVSNVNNTTHIGNAGVAITGGHVGGDAIGTAQHNFAASQSSVLDGLAKLKDALKNAPELTDEQRTDAAYAVEELEGEAKKNEGERSGSRVRNAMKNITTAISLAKGAEFFYQDVLPHLQHLLHLA